MTEKKNTYKPTNLHYAVYNLTPENVYWYTIIHKSQRIKKTGRNETKKNSRKEILIE